MTCPHNCPCPWCRVKHGAPSVFAADPAFAPSKRTGKSKSQASSDAVARHEEKTGLALCGMGKSKRPVKGKAA